MRVTCFTDQAMNLLKKIFSTKTTKKQNIKASFTEGDIFYTFSNGRYHIFKLLVFDKEFECYHVLAYEPLDVLPNTNNIANLEVAIYHAPVDRNGFKGATFLKNSQITSQDLIGYHEYLRQTQEPIDFIAIADNYYQMGLRLTDESKHYDAIDSYSKAIDLVPDFFEAIDNRAFCKMDLGLWHEAIEDFQESLEVNPGSLLAEFSIGECYLRLREYLKAREQFQRVLAVDPNHKAAKDFLKRANDLLEAQ